MREAALNAAIKQCNMMLSAAGLNPSALASSHDFVVAIIKSYLNYGVEERRNADVPANVVTAIKEVYGWSYGDTAEASQIRWNALRIAYESGKYSNSAISRAFGIDRSAITYARDHDWIVTRKPAGLTRAP